MTDDSIGETQAYQQRFFNVLGFEHLHVPPSSIVDTPDSRYGEHDLKEQSYDHEGIIPSKGSH
jgi:hypothetical protein